MTAGCSDNYSIGTLFRSSRAGGLIVSFKGDAVDLGALRIRL